MSKTLAVVGLPVNEQEIRRNVERFGNWVGGRVFVDEDRLVFSMNKINARFQADDSDLVVPVAMITNARFGKMLLVAKTVDCDFLGHPLRFRCFGRNNDKLLAALQSVGGRA